MRNAYQVEIKGKKELQVFNNKQDAEAYAITMTAWSGGKYRITEIIVADEIEDERTYCVSCFNNFDDDDLFECNSEPYCGTCVDKLNLKVDGVEYE